MADRVLPRGVDERSETSIIAVTGQTPATVTSDVLVGANRFDALILEVVLANRVASATADVKLQQLLPNGTTWYDIAAMTQLAANGSTVLVVVSGVTAIEFAVTDATMAAATIKSVPFSSRQRVKVVVGTNNFDVTVHAQYLKRFSGIQ